MTHVRPRPQQLAAILSAALLAPACIAPAEQSEQGRAENVATSTQALGDPRLDDLVGGIKAAADKTSEIFGFVSGAGNTISTVIDIFNRLFGDPEPSIGERFAALERQITAATRTIVYVTVSLDRQNTMNALQSDARTARAQVRVSGTTFPWSHPVQVDSYAKLLNAEGDLYFARTRTPWREALDEFGGPGLVYDWRLGVPGLMQAIEYRLEIIKAIDPDFTNGSDPYEFKSELRSHRDVLLAHYNRMIDGVQCRS